MDNNINIEELKDGLDGLYDTKNNKILDTKAKDCRTCQNMSCRVESYEKPVDNCVGYIHHDEKQEQPQIMSLTKKESGCQTIT